MGMALGLEKGQCNPKDVTRAIKMVPRALEPYVIGESTTIVFQNKLRTQIFFCTQKYLWCLNIDSEQLSDVYLSLPELHALKTIVWQYTFFQFGGLKKMYVKT